MLPPQSLTSITPSVDTMTRTHREKPCEYLNKTERAERDLSTTRSSNGPNYPPNKRARDVHNFSIFPYWLRHYPATTLRAAARLAPGLFTPTASRTRASISMASSGCSLG